MPILERQTYSSDANRLLEVFVMSIIIATMDLESISQTLDSCDANGGMRSSYSRSSISPVCEISHSIYHKGHSCHLHLRHYRKTHVLVLKYNYSKPYSVYQ